MAHHFGQGNRLRVAISTTYWPLIWPSPEAVTLTLYCGTSSIELPIRPQRPEDAKLRPFGSAFVPSTSSSTVLDPGGRQTKTYDWDVGRRTLTIRSERPYSRRRFDAIGTETFGSWREVLVVSDDDPTSARLDREQVSGFFRPGWDIRVESALTLRLTKDQFFLTGEIKAFDAGELFFSRRWERPITRRLV
jgi:hypothetical protein